MSQSQSNIQTQEQQLLQQQRLTPLQMQVVQLLEMPLAQLEENVRMELDANPSLDSSSGSEQQEAYTDNDSATMDADSPTSDSREDALTEALELFGRDDRMENASYSDDYIPNHSADDDSRHAFTPANTQTFLDTLYDQMHELELDEQTQQVMEYLIGSLDDDGLLRQDLHIICEELAIYHFIDIDMKQLEECLAKLQSFDPPGIGARSLQECLLLQVERWSDPWAKRMVNEILNNHYDDFINNRWHRIRLDLNMTETQTDTLQHEIRHRLNPKPGASLGEAEGRSTQQVTPDFIVHVDFDGRITFEINNGRIPVLHVVPEDEEFIAEMTRRLKQQQQPKNTSRKQSDALKFTQQNVSRAQLYIEALRQRQITLSHTMKAIISLQRKYFLSGDEADIQPMRLRDVAALTGLDNSTISRVSRSKYVQTPWGVFTLRHFFSDAYTTGDGETMSTKAIKVALQQVIDEEDKRHPLSDAAICEVMKEKGFPIARRTIAKYREQFGIPVARLRRK